MKTQIILFFFSILAIGLYAQPHKNQELICSSSQVQNTGINTKNGSKNILKVFHYDNNIIGSGIGNRDTQYTLGALIELPVETLKDYIGKGIDYIRFGIEDQSIISSANLAVYENKLDGNPVVWQLLNVDSISKGWNLFKLNQPYIITKDKSIFVGVFIETTKGGYTLTYDTDPATYPQYSGHTFLNGTYFGTLYNDIIIDADYNIQALITDGHGADFVDLSVIGIQTTSNNCPLSSAETLEVTLLNKSEISISDTFNLKLSINDKIISRQVTSTVFEPNTEITLKMPPLDMSTFGNYLITASIDYADADSSNNIFSTSIFSGNAKLSIDITTDAFPEETRWELTDIDGNIVAENEVYESETHYHRNVCLENSNCYTWKIFDKYGDGISAGAEDSLNGKFSLYFNDSLIAESQANGDFGSEFDKVGIGNGCKLNDIKITKLNMPTYELPGKLPITGIIYNMGVDTLKSFTLNYIIDNYISNTDTVKGITLPNGQSMEFTHSQDFDFNDSKLYTVQVMALSPNNTTDEQPENNTGSTKILINSGVMPRQQLIEHFTSSTSDECFTFTPTLDAILANNTSEFSLIRYQANKPAPGDPYYIKETGERMNYYGVNNIPSVYRNGVFDMEVSQDVFDYYASMKTIIEIDASASYLDEDVLINAKIKSITRADSGFVAYIAIIENTTTGNVGTNGEYEFYNVLMALLPDSKGYNLGTIPENGVISLSYSLDMSNTFVEEMNDLSAVIFVQNDSSKEVVQSLTIPIEFTDNIDVNLLNSFKAYPNPFKNQLTIENIEPGTEIKICNLLGREVYKYNSTGIIANINTDDVSPGIYIVNLISKNKGFVSFKIIKQ